MCIMGNGCNNTPPITISSYSWYIPYTYKFSRDVNFAVFAVNLSSTKFKSSKFHETQGVITNDP